MIAQPQFTDFIQFLSNPASYGNTETSVSLLQTHISVVALTERFVYKLKKNIKFDFLDFSSVDKREFYCRQEVRLNQRLSPDLYIGILPLHWNGHNLSFQSGGEVVDYVIKMHRLSDEGLLITQIKDPDFSTRQLDRIAEHLRTFYQSARPSPEIERFGTVDAIRVTIQEILSAFSNSIGQTLSIRAAQGIQKYLLDFIPRHHAIFGERIRAGKIIEGHGDLRSEHIHCTASQISIYDCIEFSLRLRCLDWLNDLAFLLMDLDYRHCHTYSAYLQTRLLSLLEHDAPIPLLNFYKTYRACVRGKVDTLKYREPEITSTVRQESKQKAIRYYQLAFQYAVLGSQPTILVCMGGAATGKSTLAYTLANEFGLLVLSSDVIRKQQAGIDLLERLPDTERSRLYRESVTDEVYTALEEQGMNEVNQRGAVILDATYRNKDKLTHLHLFCQKMGVRLLVIQTLAPAETIRERLEKRNTTPSVSDLRISDYVSGQFGVTYPIKKYIDYGLKVDTTSEMDELMSETILPWLAQQNQK